MAEVSAIEEHRDTIVALSSGALPSGVAIVRVSGSKATHILNACVGSNLQPRVGSLTPIRDPRDSVLIDVGLVLWFPGPSSFTGEDCVEFQVHGSRAVISLLLDTLCSIDGVRLAEAGEFTRRAFLSGKLDLTAIDGLSDLIASETEAQRRLALSQTQGTLRALYEDWRTRLIRIRAHIEANFDFSEEEDVPSDISESGVKLLCELTDEIRKHISNSKAGEIIRDGFYVAIIGAPNVGKSSLLNVLAKREIAIVTDQAGTTRDVLEIGLDVNGYKVVLADTAGLRDTSDKIETEGIKRAVARAKQSDLVIYLDDDGFNNMIKGLPDNLEVLKVLSKDDLGIKSKGSISAKTGHGLDWLIEEISLRIEAITSTSNTELITRERYREGLANALGHLEKAKNPKAMSLEFRAEELRLAADCIGRLTGKIDVEDLLDVIFSEFCVGK